MLRLLGWLFWVFEAAIALVAIVVAPVAAVLGFAAGETRQGWVALAVFAGGIVYALLLAYDVIDRPGDRRR